MKLPRTRYEPTISNGEPHGTPYTMSVRCWVHGAYGPVHAGYQVDRGLNKPWPEPITWGPADNAHTVPVIIPKVPVSSVMAVSYDNQPAPTNAPVWIQEHFLGLFDYDVYGETED